MTRLSRHLQAIEPSPLIALTKKIAALRADGHNVIDLGIGEPDFDTPEPVKTAATEAMTRGETKYTPMSGTPTVRKAIARKLSRENGIDYAPEQIIVSNGVKQVIFNAFTATLDPGDEVIVPAPYWMSYPGIVKLSGGVPVIPQCTAASGFKLGPDALEAAISPRTRWLLLNSPNNPSGAVYTFEELSALAEVLAMHEDILVFSDDIYEHIRRDAEPFATMAQIPAMKARTLTANGVSKAHAMTGWRLGYAAGPEWLVRGMTEVQALTTSAPSSISQAAAIAALDEPVDALRERAESFLARGFMITEMLANCPGLHCHAADGSFYNFVDCRGLLGKRTPSGSELGTDYDVADWLLADCHVALLPGSAFGTEGYLRISTAASIDSLRIAAERIQHACRRIG